MPTAQNSGGSRRRLSRRTFLKSGVAFAGTLPLAANLVGCWDESNLIPAFPRYILRREVDEVFLELAAIGYQEIRHWGLRYLEPDKRFSYRYQNKEFSFPHLIFRFPPQHFAEMAIGVKNLPATLPEDVLSKIALFPAGTSKLVFRDPERKRLGLTLDELLNWQSFQLALPNLDLLQYENGYALEVQNPEEGPTDSVSLFESGQAFTQIEMPWGIYLQPIGSYGVPQKAGAGEQNSGKQFFVWDHSIAPVRVGRWAELWGVKGFLQSTALENTSSRDSSNQFEIARGSP